MKSLTRRMLIDMISHFVHAHCAIIVEIVHTFYYYNLIFIQTAVASLFMICCHYLLISVLVFNFENQDATVLLAVQVYKLSQFCKQNQTGVSL